MNEYTYKVCLCEGHYCNGNIVVNADTEDEAYDKAMGYVLVGLAAGIIIDIS